MINLIILHSNFLKHFINLYGFASWGIIFFDNYNNRLLVKFFWNFSTIAPLFLIWIKYYRPWKKLLNSEWIFSILFHTHTLFIPLDFRSLLQVYSSFPLFSKLDEICNFLTNIFQAVRDAKRDDSLFSNWPDFDYTNMFTPTVYTRRSQKRKKTVKSAVSFCAFSICAQKSCF